MIFSDKVWDHFEAPRNVGELDSNDSNVGCSIIGSISVGQIVQLHINVVNNIIQDARFKAYGCGTTIACASWSTEWAIGKTLQQATQLHNTDIVEALALTPLKIHCAVAAEQALQTALKDYLTKQK